MKLKKQYKDIKSILKDTYSKEYYDFDGTQEFKRDHEQVTSGRLPAGAPGGIGPIGHTADAKNCSRHGRKHRRNVRARRVRLAVGYCRG